MPRRYTAIRDACVKSGGNYDKCQTKAARIFNATRKKGEAPVTGRRKEAK